MTEDIKSRICAIYKQEKITSNNLFLFDEIPPIRLKNAISKYASSLNVDETVIMLYDDSAFGSGKEGFLLTSKRLYCRNMMEKAAFTEIANITNIRYLSEVPTGICVETHSGNFKIDATLVKSLHGKAGLRNILSKAVWQLINLTVGSTVGSGDMHSALVLKCKGCGAPNDSNRDNCEYCGSDLSVARQEIADAAMAASGNNRYYKEFPDVPEFGAVAGIPILRMKDESDLSGLNIFYYYGKVDIPQALIDNYIELAHKNGIEYLGNEDDLFRHSFRQRDRLIEINLLNEFYPDDEVNIQILDNCWSSV